MLRSLKNSRKSLFLHFLLKTKTDSRNLKVWSEHVRYKKVFCPVALFKQGMLRWEEEEEENEEVGISGDATTYLSSL